MELGPQISYQTAHITIDLFVKKELLEKLWGKKSFFSQTNIIFCINEIQYTTLYNHVPHDSELIEQCNHISFTRNSIE